MDELTVLLTGHHIFEVNIEDAVDFNIKLYKQIERIEELENELEGRTKEEKMKRLEYDPDDMPSLKDDEEKLDKLLNNKEFWKLFKERYGEDSIYSKAISEV